MQSNVKKIIRIKDDGTQDEVKHGAVIELQGDNIAMDFVGIATIDIVRIAFGFLDAVQQMGLGNEMDQLVNYYCNRGSEGEDADEGLQPDIGSEE